MNIVDLFCGGGGSSAGFHQAGFTTEFAVDLAEHCIDTFKLNFGDVVHKKDVSKLRYQEIERFLSKPPTIVTASPPCEPFTSANQNRIFDPFDRLYSDETGRLMLHAIRLIADLNPEYYFIENVKGILDGENQELLREEIIDSGLSPPYFNIIEAERWGVPSKRTRVIISNIDLICPDFSQISVHDAIGDLPLPNYPDKYEWHITSSLPEKYMANLPSTSFGQSLVYFMGAKKQYQNYIRILPDVPAPVVMGKSRFIHYSQDRILTPLENARLMTFPDTHQYTGSLDYVYDIIGEAVPPKITYEIAKQITSMV
ncbi:MAG: DNA cytosine methyltransferase [Candidatus Heimdallarchaeota archaeon]|nr:DNA cytosine methyltransferase [Candidatus Heimdallarchaeota archaeon]MDH5645748.1 DNA cytosine methyltransferase [Candidatus Heimdallarchaeota archaeon]